MAIFHSSSLLMRAFIFLIFTGVTFFIGFPIMNLFFLRYKKKIKKYLSIFHEYFALLQTYSIYWGTKTYLNIYLYYFLYSSISISSITIANIGIKFLLIFSQLIEMVLFFKIGHILYSLIGKQIKILGVTFPIIMRKHYFDKIIFI